MINNIYVLNCPDETKRLDICREHLLNSKVSSEKIKVFEAKSHKSYHKSRELCEDAIRDGFDFFDKGLAVGIQNKVYIGYLAQAWSYMRFMRHIIETDESSILIHDDSYFTCSFDNLLNSFDKLPYMPILASLCSPIPEGYTLPKWIDSRSCFVNGLPEGTALDWGVYYSPEGAALILKNSIKLVEYMFGTWYWPILWHDSEIANNDKVFSLQISPTSDNIENIETIHQMFIKNLHERDLENFGYYDYCCVQGIPGIKSTMHGSEGQVVPSIRKTRD